LFRPTRWRSDSASAAPRASSAASSASTS
jgi:hypothetical protein